MDWLALVETIVRRIPLEKILLPPRDKTKELKEFYTTFQAPGSETSAPPGEKLTPTPEKPKGVALGGSTGVVTREGLDPQRLAYQDNLIRGELWLLEAHLKNNCIGCGGDLDCCWKHSHNILDAARETQSMTTETLYRDSVSLAGRVIPFVHPDDVKAGKYLSKYPALAVEVSQVRTQFDKRVQGYARPPVTLEEAKKIAAEAAEKEAERAWHSQDKKQ